MKKTIVFILALVLPVLIYLFMQGFGKNEYQLPILYQESVPLLEDCDVSAPFSLGSSQFFEADLQEQLPLIIDVRKGSVDVEFIENELARVDQYFEKPFYRVLTLMSSGQQSDNVRVLTSEELDRLVRCTLLYRDNNSFITLVDKQGRIRSYFESDKKRELDRLITELEILKQYE